jgi:hypothetical protein
MFKIQGSSEKIEKPLSNRFSTWKCGKPHPTKKLTQA